MYKMNIRKYVPAFLFLFLFYGGAYADTISIKEIWTITNEYGGGGFEGEITIPVRSSISSWRITVQFDKAVRNFQVYQAELTEEFDNRTTYIIENAVWNGFLRTGDEIYFRIQGFADDETPKLTVTYQDTVYKTLSPRQKPRPISNRELKLLINAKVDYEKAIRLSLKFFEAQRSGFLAKDNRIKWKSSSGLYDGALQGVNLVGGYYIDGSYVKYNFPMAFATTQLVWGALEFQEGYEAAGEMDNLFKAIKWATDYFIKCHTAEKEYYGMVGDPDIESKHWEKSDNMNWERPAYVLNPDKPGSDVTAETAAALAAASFLFKTTAPAYSKKLVKHAKELWQFAERNRERYDFKSITKASPFYGSTSYDDELIWGAIWLYKATKDQFYLNFVDSIYGRLLQDFKDGLSYDDKLLGIQLLLADINMDYRTYMYPVRNFCEEPGEDSTHVLPNGLLFKDVMHGPVGFSANAAFVCAIAAKKATGSPEGKKYLNFAKSQVHAILGTRNKDSYMVGFGKNYPQNIHHRDSSCPSQPAKCGWEFYDDTTGSNANELLGALVGGPDWFGQYDDTRENVDLNQPNILFNSAFQSAAAGLMAFDNGDLDIESSGGGSGDLPDDEPFRTTLHLGYIFRDTDEKEPYDVCASNPCKNDAVCENTEGMEFNCTCFGNYFGKLCDEKLNPEFQWVSTWPDGGQVHIHLPSSMFKGKKQLFLAFPPNCMLSSVEVWHSCLVPSVTDISEKMVVIQQFGWQSNQKFVGMKFETDNPDSTQACLTTEDFGFKISEQENEDSPICVKSLPEVTATTPPSTTTKKPLLPTIRPLKEDRRINGSNAEIREPEVLPTVMAEKRVPDEDDFQNMITDLGLKPAEPSLISWISTWGSGGTGHINIPRSLGLSGTWVLRFLFPPKCPLAKAEFWHACVVSDLSEPENGLFTFKQVGWQIYQTFIGMTIHFEHVITSVDCYEQSSFYVLFEDSSAGSGLYPDTCKVKFDDIEPRPKTDDDEASYVVGDVIKYPETENDDEEEPVKPINLRNLWLSGNDPTPSPNTATVSRLRAKPKSGTAVELSWRAKKAKPKKVQISYKPQTEENEEDQSDDDDEKEEKKSAPKVAKLKLARRRPPSTTTDVSGRKSKVFIPHLQPGRTYVFTVRLWDGRSYGPSSSVTVTMEPSEIEDIRPSNPNDTSLHFEWKKPPGIQDMYRVSYFPSSSGGFPKSPFKLDGNATETTVVGLDKETDYVFVFVVKNGNVMSEGKYVFAKTGEEFCSAECPDISKCVQTEKGAECMCDVGYQKKNKISVISHLNQINHRQECEDIDECSAEKICHEKANCINTQGSYRCECKSGYEGDGLLCYDVNECLLSEVDVCPGAACKNKDGTYECECEEGFVYRGTSCRDIDECASDKPKCPSNATCINTKGSFTCECPKGTLYFENECQDINECRKNTHSCRKSEICLNTRGGYSCVCGKGKRKTKRHGCRDINECKENTHTCSKYATCKNTRPGYKCHCKDGFIGNGFLCKDYNECIRGHDCDETGGICLNFAGSYACSCKEGYTGDGKTCFSLF